MKKKIISVLMQAIEITLFVIGISTVVLTCIATMCGYGDRGLFDLL